MGHYMLLGDIVQIKNNKFFRRAIFKFKYRSANKKINKIVHPTPSTPGDE